MPFLSVNPSVRIFFYYQRTYRQTKNYRWKIHLRSISVCDSISKLITDRITVQIPMKFSVDKYKDCGSVTHCVRIICLYATIEFFICCKFYWNLSRISLILEGYQVIDIFNYNQTTPQTWSNPLGPYPTLTQLKIGIQ
jgi:hypothetical protein